MTTVVLMVRHASHDRLGKVLCGRMAGVRLGPKGLSEAETLARRLAPRALAAVYASPLERARETAEPIARAQGVKVTVDPDLNEIDFGDWNGCSFEQLDADPAWSLWNSQRDIARPPGGESMLEVQARLARFLQRMHQRHADAEVVVVSHSDVIKAALACVLGLTLRHYDRFEISPASISRVALSDWGATVHSINEAAA